MIKSESFVEKIVKVDGKSRVKITMIHKKRKYLPFPLTIKCREGYNKAKVSDTLKQKNSTQCT